MNRQALLANFGVNTSQLTHDVSKLPSTEPPKSRRKRHVDQASRVAPAEVGGAYGTNDGDVKAWGRNWHETVILSGIEMQRQRVSDSRHQVGCLLTFRRSKRSMSNSNNECWPTGN
jgi:nuclear pore complex protein Nup93